MKDIILASVLTCPHCGFAKQDACFTTSAVPAGRCYDQRREIVACFVLSAR